MIDFGIFKQVLVILMVIQPDNSADSNSFENFYVLIRMVAVPLFLVSFLNGPHEGNKLLWNDPVKITILYSLVKLVFLNIEGFELVPTKFQCPAETL